MARDLREVGIEVVSVGLLEHCADPGVQLEPLRGREVVVERLAQQLVDEGVAPRERRVLGDHAGLGRLGEDIEQLCDPELGRLLEHPQLELPPGNGRHAQRRDRVSGEVGEPAAQQHADLFGDRPDRIDDVALVSEALRLHQPQHLTEEERVAAREHVQARGRRLRHLLTGHALDVCLDVLDVEARERQPRAEPGELPEKLRTLVGLGLALAVGTDQDDGRPADGLAHEAHQDERSRVRGVQVVEHDQERLRLSALDEEASRRRRRAGSARCLGRPTPSCVERGARNPRPARAQPGSRANRRALRPPPSSARPPPDSRARAQAGSAPA